MLVSFYLLISANFPKIKIDFKEIDISQDGKVPYFSNFPENFTLKHLLHL